MSDYIKEDDLFSVENAEKNESDFGETIFCGKAEPRDGRTVIQIQLNTDKIKIQDHLDNGIIGFSLIEKKSIDCYGNTHFLAVNQDISEWPAVREKSLINLTDAIQKTSFIHLFTLSVEQIQRIMYKHGSFGTFAKVELVTDGITSRIFRYYKKMNDELIAFRDGRKMTSTTPAKKEEEDDTAYYEDLLQ